MNRQSILEALSKKKGIELIQFSKEYGSFFKLDNSNVETTGENEKILSAISKLNLEDILAIRDDLMAKFSIAMEDIVTVGSGQSSAAEVDSSTFKVILKTIDDSKKTAAIKVIKDITGLTIADSKAIVDKVIGGNEYTFKEDLTKPQADELVAKLVKESINAVAQAG